MNIFGFEIRKIQAENSPTVYKKSGGFFGSTGEEPLSNLDLLYTIYKKNTDCRRCVSLIGKNIGMEGRYIKKGDVIVEDKYIQEILKGYTRNLVTKIVRDVLVSGNAYIVKLRNAQGKLVGLDTVDPRTVRVVATDDGTITSYKQFHNGIVTKTYPVEDIVNCYDESDPDNEIFGLSVLESIILDTLADKESALSNYYYFKNNAIPARLLIAREGTSDAELQNTVEQLRKNFSGGKNKHKVGILRGIESIEKIQDSMSDMQYEVLRSFTTERVCVAFDVPRVILGYTDGVNYSNHEGQYRKFIQNTINVRENTIGGWISEALELEEGYEFEFRSTKFDITKENIEAMEIKARNGRITPNEARVELGYEAFDIPEADELLISKNYDKLVDVGLSDIPNIGS